MSENNTLSFATANAVYDVLVKHAGEIEDEDSRDMFVHAQTTEYIREYRFMGGLGFGGKFWREDWSGKWFVNCYPENLNKRTEALIAETNAALKELHKQFN